MKIFELLNELTNKELKQFEKFIHSPYYNEDFDLELYFDSFILKVILIPLENVSIQKKEFLKKNQWNDSKFRKYSHLLLEALIEFNAVQSLKMSKKSLLIKKYEGIVSKKWISISNRYENKIEESFSQETDFSGEELALRYSYLKAKIKISGEESNLNSLFQTINQLYQLETNSIDLEYETLQLGGYNIDKPKFENVISINSNPISRCYYHTRNLFEGKDTDVQLAAITEILHSHPSIPNYVKEHVILRCTNYLISRLNKGEVDLYNKIWQLYRLGLDIEAFIPNVGLYRNIAYLSCKAEEFDWALEFVEKYKDSLDKDQQESAYSFTKARIYGNMKNWSQVLETLREVEYEDITYNLNSKLYLMIAYYELDEFDVLDSLIKSFKVFLRRRRNISANRKAAFYGFTTVIGHLFKAEERRDSKRLLKAREQLKLNTSIPNQDWLIEKIEELEAIYSDKKHKPASIKQ